MDPKDIERLQRNWIVLLDSVNSDEVVPYLMQSLIFDADTLEEISLQGTRKKKTELMLRILIKRGPNAYSSFRSALQEIDVYHHLIDKLDKIHCQDVLIAQPSEDLTDTGGPISQPGSLRADGGVTPPTPSTQSTPDLPVVRSLFTDLECLDLADLLDQERDFPRLGLCLNFTDPAMSRFRRENSVGGCSTGTYKMLIEWKKRYLEHEQREHLSTALDTAGLKSLGFQVRYGQKLEIVASPPPSTSSVPYSAMSFQSSLSSTSTFSQPIYPPGSLHAPNSQIGLGPRLGPNTTLPKNIHPSDGEDVQDTHLYNLSRRLNLDCYQRLGLSLGYSLDQLDAFTTKKCNDIPNAGLDMMRDLKSHVGHIRKAEFKALLETQANLPSLVHLL